MLRGISLMVAGLAAALVIGCGGSKDGGLKGTGGTAGAAGAAGSGGSGASGGNGGTGASSSGGNGGSAGSGPCEDNGDCPSGVCDAGKGVCVECLFTTDCESGSRCIEQRCVADTSCNNSLDCVDSPTGPICDPATSRCEQCVDPTDCDGTADCVDHRCVPFTACKNSLDCESGQVCDPALERCVECASSTDCESGQSCVANHCKTLVDCASDNQCTPFGQLCDKVLGVCADCLKNADCPASYHCAQGGCVLNACATGSSRCDGNSLESCLPDGTGWSSAQPCGSNSTCIAAGAQASCVPWECEPSTTYCAGSEKRTCAADGLSSTLVEDCATGGLNCVAGACSAQVCDPNSYYCEGDTVRLCNSTGTASVLDETCASNQYCNPVSTFCEAHVCPPNQPVCNGDLATTCNANGSGYVSGGTNCASSGQTCSAGACTSCGNSQRSLRLTEVYMGSGDYVVIQNRSASCSANLQGLVLSAPTDNASGTVSWTLPSKVLAPMAKVRVLETEGVGQPGDINVSGSIAWLADSPGAALLCQGMPCSAANVVDAMRWWGTTATFPAGVSFSPVLTSITASNEETTSYFRSTFNGSAPNFTPADWTTGAASLPSNAGGSNCPATQPVNGSNCAALGSNCTYGAVTCSCFLTWTCS